MHAVHESTDVSDAKSLQGAHTPDPEAKEPGTWPAAHIAAVHSVVWSPVHDVQDPSMTDGTPEKSLQQTLLVVSKVENPGAHVAATQSLAAGPVQISHNWTEGTVAKGALHEVQTPAAKVPGAWPLAQLAAIHSLRWSPVHAVQELSFTDDTVEKSSQQKPSLYFEYPLAHVAAEQSERCGSPGWDNTIASILMSDI